MNNPLHTHYLVGAHSDKGPVRAKNEDAYWVPEATTPVELGALYIVADGVGGQAEGAAAAQLAVLMIRDAFYRSRNNGRSIPEALTRAINRANQAIYEEAQSAARRMGCTLVVAILEGDDLYLAHVGDARAYLTRQGKLERLTKDDTWVEKQVEAGIISPEQAAKHELRNIVIQVLGNKPEIEINQQQQKLSPGETLLLCSDGLYDKLDNSQLYQIIQQQPPAAAATALVQAAIAAQATDNVTAILVQNPPGVASAIGPSRSRFSNWPLLFIIFAIVLLGLLLLFWRNARSDPAESSLINPTASQALPADTAVPSLPTSTVDIGVVIPPTSTLNPTATATATATPLPTATASATATPSLYACVIGQANVWQDSQISAGRCGLTVSQEYSLEANQEVLVLNPVSTEVPGPDTECNLNRFINVQSVANPEIEGWVLEYSISEPSPDRGCANE